MFGKLASMFVEIESGDENAPQQTKPQEAPVPPQVQQQAPITQTPQVAAPAIPGAVDEGMVEFLAQAIEDANLPGFDYLEFRNALAAMANAQMPENSKYIAVFATASTMGLTKEGLLSAIDHYQSILDSKRQEFIAQVEQMTANEVTKREELMEAKKAEIEALTLKIQEAQQEIATIQQETLNINSEIGQEKLNIQQTSASFEATYNFVSGKLQGDRQKIETFIS